MINRPALYLFVLIVAAVGVAFGFAFISFHLGIPVAAGAFFTGVLIAESRSHAVTSVLATPVKDIFAALFFVSVGALMDFKLIPLFRVPTLILIWVSIDAKFVTVYISSRLQMINNLTSTRTALGFLFWRRNSVSSSKGWNRCRRRKSIYITNDRNHDNHYHFHFALCY
ncbi:hypothetical protein BH23THE1_BH23THE1_23110 [soil metagenome]